MLKYAIVNNNKVENIIVCESVEFIEQIKPLHQHVEFVGDENNSKNIQVGFVWDGSKFFEDPELMRIIKESKKEFDDYIESLKLKPDLTDSEKQLIEIMEKGV